MCCSQFNPEFGVQEVGTALDLYDLSSWYQACFEFITYVLTLALVFQFPKCTVFKKHVV